MNRRRFLTAIGAATGAALAGCINTTCSAGYDVELKPATDQRVRLNGYRQLDELDRFGYRRYVLEQFVDAPTETTYTGFDSASLADGELIEFEGTFYEMSKQRTAVTGSKYTYNASLIDEAPSGETVHTLETLDDVDSQALLYDNDTITGGASDTREDVQQVFDNYDVVGRFPYVLGTNGVFDGESPRYVQLGNLLIAFTEPQSKTATFDRAEWTMERVAQTPSDAAAYARTQNGAVLTEETLTEDDKAVLDAAVENGETTVCTGEDEETETPKLSESTRRTLKTTRYVQYRGDWYIAIVRQFVA